MAIIINGRGRVGARPSSGGAPAPSYLLDTYGGSSVAYSFRKLSSTYSGNCIRVRRSSDNAEQNIGFNGDVLDTASLLSFVGSGSGYVVTIYDQSGNGNNANQTFASYQQRIVNSGSIVLDSSKPALDGYCSGTIKPGYKMTSQISYLSSFTVAHVLNTTIVNYFNARETAPFVGVAWGISFNGNPDKFFHKMTDGLTYEIYTPGRTLNRTLFTDSLRSSKLYTSINSANEIDNGSYSSFQYVDYIIGREQENVSGLQFQGLFQEFIAFQVNNSSNISSIKTNINNYYGIY
jgi:hypothetical protein